MNNREANFAGHPHYCTCVDCTKARFEKLKGVEIPRLQKCPRCRRTSLLWNEYVALFECLNLECKKRFTPDDLSREAAETTESKALHGEQTHQALKKSELLGASSSNTSYKARQEPSPTGRAWFGKKYSHPKGRRWKKPKRAFPIKMDEMLKLTAKLLLVCAGIVCIVLGAHGLYVYFSGLEKVELLWGAKDPSDLFMTLNVPSWLDSIVSWATFRGIWSWFIPAAIVVGGILALYWQSKIYVRKYTRYALIFAVIAIIATIVISGIAESKTESNSNLVDIQEMTIGKDIFGNYYLHIWYKPPHNSLVGRPYTLYLYENSEKVGEYLRDSRNVTWDALDINTYNELSFGLSRSEYEYYYEKTYYSEDITKELSKYFTVRVQIEPYTPP